ncbi:MAG: bi-domain-containing oxidoreductase [Kordia sp.]|uniref:bi-domain-containing oxidoreductase n=1 Tax=Kordia sp. TaxID=1965332 RepID=UPI00385F191C
MKQILQSFKTGVTDLAELPAPKVKAGQVLIQTTRSLVSLGTERMLVEFGKASLIQKARQQPDKVKMVLDKIKSEGLMPTLEAVFSKLEQPLPLGYCNVGKVIEVGAGVDDFKVGDRVVSNGQHAEFVSIPKNLVAHIPDNISDEEAVFTVIGAIGLQGIRLVKPTLGETIVVIGLGLVGLLTAEMLVANGCNVIGYDLDDNKVAIANSKGIQAFNPAKGNNPVNVVMNATNQVGADAVIITASAKTNAIIKDAANMSRKRGRIVLVGIIGLNIARPDFYEKELSFQVSCSYGPGRYDDEYEINGTDYPLPFVRWTEKRNFEAVLKLISTGKLQVEELISEVVDLEDFDKIYGDIGSSKSIASIIKYKEGEKSLSRKVKVHEKSFAASKSTVGIIGAGNFAKMTLLPALKGSAADLKYISSSGGVNGTELAKKHNIAYSVTENKEMLTDDEVNMVMITTRPNHHVPMVLETLKHNKHVFVEKPLAINPEGLQAVMDAYYAKDNKNSITVGFNRRFSPHIEKMKSLVGNNVLNVVATMNAGHIPYEMWFHDMDVNGGRIIAEGVHYIDLISYLTGSKVKSVMMNAMGENPAENTDNASILLKYENGSTGVVNYFSNGAKSYSKERLEVYFNESTLIMDNFRQTKGYNIKGFKKMKTKLNKGHKNQFNKLMTFLKEGGDPIMPFEDVVNATKASFAAIESLKTKQWVDVTE